MGDLFEGYGAVATQRAGTPPWDEMFASADLARGSYREIHASLARMTQEELRGRTESLAKALVEQLNDDVEIKVKGDALQVTASSEDQQAVGRLIQLIQRKGRTPSTEKVESLIHR